MDKGRSLWDDAWDSLRRNRAAMTALGVMGFVVALLLFAPIPYVDVTSSWRLRSKWQRIAISAAPVRSFTSSFL